MFLAVSQIGYEAGTLGFVLGAIYLVGLTIFGVFSSDLRASISLSGVDNLISLYEKNFGSNATLIFSGSIFLIYLFLLSAQFVGMYEFYNYLDRRSILSHQALIIILGVALASVAIYPIVGGLAKDIRTDVIQFGLILIATGILMFELFRFDWSAQTLIPPTADQITGMGYGAVFLIGAIVFLTPSFFVRFDMWQRAIAAGDDRSAKFGFILSGLFSLFFYCFFSSLGLIAYMMDLGTAKTSALDVIVVFVTNPVLLGVVLAAFFAAVLSSADTFINTSSLNAARLFSKDRWNSVHSGNSNDGGGAVATKLLLQTRYWAATIFVVAALLALISQDFVNLFVGAFSVILIFLMPVISLFSDRLKTVRGAFWAPMVGIAVFLILFFTWDPKMAFVPAVFLSIMIYLSLLWFVRSESRKDRSA